MSEAQDYDELDYLDSVDDDDCPDCFGEGGYHDCGEDTCCCLDPGGPDDPGWRTCHVCGGSGR